MNSASPGMSEGTYAAGQEHWASLSSDLSSKNASEIDAPDDVEDYRALSEDPRRAASAVRNLVAGVLLVRSSSTSHIAR